MTNGHTYVASERTWQASAARDRAVYAAVFNRAEQSVKKI